VGISSAAAIIRLLLLNSSFFSSTDFSGTPLVLADDLNSDIDICGTGLYKISIGCCRVASSTLL